MGARSKRCGPDHCVNGRCSYYDTTAGNWTQPFGYKPMQSIGLSLNERAKRTDKKDPLNGNVRVIRRHDSTQKIHRRQEHGRRPGRRAQLATHELRRHIDYAATYFKKTACNLTVSVTRWWGGRDNAILSEPTSSHANCLKTRRLPPVGCTLC